MWKNAITNNIIQQDPDLIRVFLADVVPPQSDAEVAHQRMAELENLVSTYHGLVVVKCIQKKYRPDYKSYIGTGKLQEIKQEMKQLNATVLIIGNILKPWQLYYLNTQLKEVWVQVRDRVDLILKIFERHATSTESRLQIQLAAIKHMGPRIFGMGMELSRQWGWMWWAGWRAGRGIGETNTERMSRHLREQQDSIKAKLKEYQNVRALHRESRLRKNLPTVGVVWYTNAGKSSLMQLLTGKKVYIADKLFATLGTNVGTMIVPSDTGKPWQILINDTIWFIRDLPPSLIKAFTSTLEDSIESHILLHVIDGSDPVIHQKKKVVEDILAEIWATQQKIFVINKIDLCDGERRARLMREFGEYDPCYVSVRTEEGIPQLKQRIIDAVWT